MLDSAASLQAANYRDEVRREFPVLGLVAVGVWVASLAIGLLQLAIGHESAAIAALLVSVAAPWVGLALAHYPTVARHLKRFASARRKSFGPIGVNRI